MSARPKRSTPSEPAALSEAEIIRFRRELLHWFERHARDLPWRRTHDPYAIWISEIMLQQTRVAATVPFYQRFLARFPDIASLADAPESDLLAHWAGLGYYHRARNLQRAAQIVHHAGSFPATFAAIRDLPGIGDYTAAAVSSIAFHQPHAALDGNVFRVLSRVFNDPTNIAAASARPHFAQFADQLLDHTAPGTFNQAMMELGATICLPKAPQCLLCPVADLCRARSNGTQSQLPVNRRPNKSVTVERLVFWIERGDSLLLWQRPPGARLMPGFWELPEHEQIPDLHPETDLGSFTHGITFHRYRFRVVSAAPPSDLGPCQWIPADRLSGLPLSTIAVKAKRVIQRAREAKASHTKAAVASA